MNEAMWTPEEDDFIVKMVAGVIVKMAALRLAAHWRRESGGARTGCGQVAGAPLLNAPLKGG